MALRVTTAGPQPKLKVTTNSGMQGSTYNPQRTAPSTVLQNPITANRLQPAAAARTVQPAANAAAIQAAAAAQAAAVAAEVARQRQVIRDRFQGALNLKVEQNRAAIITKVAAASPQPRLRVTRARPAIRIRTPWDDLSEDEREKLNAYWSAIGDYDQRRKSNKKGLAKLWDKITFGQDRRDSEARAYAESRLKELSEKKVDDYKKSVNTFLKSQAKKRAAIEGAKFKSRGEFDAAVSDYEKWEASQIDKLRRAGLSLEGTSAGYTKAASAPVTSATGRVFGAFSKLNLPGQSALGKIWQYTLGGGSKNLPSVVTAPSRFINFFGNINTANRTIYKSGGGTTNRLKTPDNAWQATFNQRNFNIRPWLDRPFDPKIARKVLPAGKLTGKFYKSDAELRQLWKSYNRRHRGLNSVFEVAADPLNFLPEGWLSKARKSEFAGSFVDRLVSKKPVARFLETSSKLRESKAISWLTDESRSPGQVLGEAIDDARKARGIAQEKILPRLKALNESLPAARRLDVSIFDDIKSLTDYEASILQRMVDGQLTRRDRVRLVGPGNAPIRDRLETLASKWTNFTEQMKLADNVQRTRFGRGKKLYAPNTSWVRKPGRSLDDYNFLARKRLNRRLSARDLEQGLIDRYFRSNLDDFFSQEQLAKVGGMKRQREFLQKEYDDLLEPALAKVDKAYAKTRTPIGRLRTLNSAYGPTAIWKKSVLKYRPAWYVNNFLYNTQAAALSGGGRALVEQARLLRPRNFRRAMDEIPESLKSDIVSEIGNRGRLSRFGNNVENLSRMAAFRALKKRGFSDDDAIKRVDRYLLNYTTKNWERPIKAVMPFFKFQQGIAKAAVHMPFDKSIASVAYNRLDRFQQQQFDRDFSKVVPKLLELGYTESEIEQMKNEQAKYFRGRLKVGNKYITTPFNAFSEKGLSNLGLNPYLSALGEAATARDSFGRKISGSESTFLSRLISKFPQAQVLKEARAKYFDVPGEKPTRQWIGAPGSEGYGLTKEAQGHDRRLPNYQKKLDKGANFFKDIAAFAGIPSNLEFDKKTFLQRKTMQKLKTEYFATDWSQFSYEESERRRTALFKKYHITPDKFYKGELAKYDDANTKNIKSMKEEARKKTASLYAEYFKQPKGQRNVWATQKLKELVSSGYFEKNPFLRSFDWTNPDTITKAYKQIIVQKALKTGDWSEYRQQYGTSPKLAGWLKHLAYDKAKKSGDWSAYFAKYGISEKAKRAQFWEKYYAAAPGTARRQLLRDNPEFAKTGVKSEAEIAEGKFWHEYSLADRDTRRRLIRENPQFNKRANWTPQMWDAWRAESRQQLKNKARKLAGFSAAESRNLFLNHALAAPVLKKPRRQKFVRLSLQ